jgi:NADH-quinone oxidoreductase subunit H
MNIQDILILILMPIFVSFMGLLFMGIQRKIMARVQNRMGPPFYQQFIDVIKLFSKRENFSHNWVFDIGPLFAIVGMITTMLFIPMGGFALLSGDGDLIVVMYLLVISGLGMALGAGASGNPNAGIGVMRGLTLMMAYELPFVLSVLAVMIYYHTTSLAQIVESQKDMWALLLLPLSAIVADIALQAQFGKKPFDQPIAPAEVATGPIVEYGGKYMGMLMLAHSIGMFVEAGLFIDLFLGGGIIFHQAGMLYQALNFIFWIFLVFLIYTIAVLISTVFPRYRIDQAFTFYWKWPTILAIIGLFYALGVSAW